jgi:hypothetical protein
MVLVVVNLLSHVTNTTPFEHTVTCHAHKTLKHSSASVLANLRSIVVIERNVDNCVLHVEEGNGSEDVDGDDHEQESPRELIRVHSDCFHDVGQRRELNNNVQQMEGVVELVDLETEDRDTEVKHVVLENSVLHEEVDVVELNFHLGKSVSEIGLLTDVELLSLNALRHENQVSLFD